MHKDKADSFDVLVIGAGMAGLTAARSLVEAGLHVLLLEAQNRIGGRILTQHLHGEALERGAEFIHGRPPELWALIAEAGLDTYEREGSQICFENGSLAECGDDRSGTFEFLDSLKSFAGTDLSIAAYLDREKIPDEARRSAIGFIEGFNAADHRQASVAALGYQQQAEDAIDGDRTFRLRGGYDQLPAYLATRFTKGGGTLRLDSPVHEIRWKRGEVEAFTGGDIVRVRRPVITLPLGVLLSEKVSFIPSPADVFAAAAKLRMGTARRFTLLFRERFWASLDPQPGMEALSFLFAEKEMPPVWWTPHPEASNTITGWVGGPRSAAFSGVSSGKLAQSACAALARILTLDDTFIQSMLLACETHDWQLDPYTLGAYSYVGVNGLEAPGKMGIPVDDTLYFAGEHTDTTGHWGTVHAAMRSGLRAAEQILSRS